MESCRTNTVSVMRKFGVFIGRFQPLHNAHVNVLRRALASVGRLVVVIGSDSQAKTIKNPWTSDERVGMVKSCISQDEVERIEFVRVRDDLYNDANWLLGVTEKVNIATGDSDDIALVGYRKDKTTALYLSMFPQWEFLDVGDQTPDDVCGELSATQIRDSYFRGDLTTIKPMVPPSVFDIVKASMMRDSVTFTDEFSRLKDEFDHVQEYKELWSVSPYPPTFVTVDAVVIKSGHVLVVRRRCQPGKGLIALPGGFVNSSERLETAAVRELKEETRIKLPKAELAASISSQKVFDHPDRSLRGRTITHSYLMNLGTGALPRVKGDDDAAAAWWMPLREVLAKEESFFEDHFHIISYFINRY